MGGGIDPTSRRIISIDVDQIRNNNTQKRNIGSDVSKIESPFFETLAEAIAETSRREQTTHAGNYGLNSLGHA